MTALEKIARLAAASSFDSAGPAPGLAIDPAKVEALGRGTKYDLCTSSAAKRESEGGLGSALRGGLCHTFTGSGRCVSLFKTLYTNDCSHDCGYCPNASVSSRKKTFSYAPEELARITLAFYKENRIEGLFLSSGMGRDEGETMEEMIETVRLLRAAHHFRGYVHLKILPGSSKEHVREAMELADRVSVNLEAPSSARMAELCPSKEYENDILARQRYVRDLSREVSLPAGQTTQMVVGAAGETDREIFDRILLEYDVLKLKRVYFSAFTPLAGTAFEDRKKAPAWREHRLYQVDWLYRVYKLAEGEISAAFDDDGFLRNSDPKVAIARASFEEPIDPNGASFAELIRVPGIGPKSARRILLRRKNGRIERMRDLVKLGVAARRAEPFLKVGGKAGTTLDRWGV
ncbi:radical SAM protein [Methanotrichaceae archaeon M04Ac]|uniref:Radical SAM protein n=1 Tax=Candidatus Methanocrinis alkalitolerans TaxID=3033395 RepID=A0ABT5XHH9_9EURY|nr:radical SAM protein [Candidatus Methanocrinis alkalitolerans]MCR3884643.1 radical SAM protein [Methanothrix sp.]MDF0594180.1 radical SAM protein [Candidatus Methanocrinis alkalitolerans]